MTTTKSDVQSPGRKPSSQSAVEALLVTVGSQTEPGHDEKVTAPRPLRIYTRAQILRLYNSPLVKSPPDMPELRYWFGSENEHSGKKEAEPSTPSSARERRFRRDADDGETPSRATFRSTLSQPSQMGNFKHQSLRASDRDRDRDRDKDGEKDRERDIRDKEGQERLRNLSDKYDRDRLALPLANLRGKERDAAPHLAAGSSSRPGAPTQLATVAARRADTREAAKKKAGETSEDWRRGAEPPRSTREERSDNGRKDRDDRERPRSRVRDVSRPRREPSIPRRDRERDDREIVRDRDRRGDRDRDDYRRERDDYRRDRDRDLDRELELDDPRRWRDDGKRDDRMAARRGDRQSDREHRDRERPRDRAPHEAGWEPSHDRRWTVVEERDGRSKRNAARDRRGVPEEGKDKEDRKDREREKEKEPAWMDTYIPSASSAGILGGKGDDGELDGIQTWKKGMKEKEQRDKGTNHVKEDAGGYRPSGSEKPKVPEKQLDEIQLFRLLMKKEEEKKMTDQPIVVKQDDARPLASPATDSTVPGLMRIQDQRKVPALSNSDAKIAPNSQAVKPGSDMQPGGEEVTFQNSRLDLPPTVPSPHSEVAPAAVAGTPRSLLSILASKDPSTHHVNPPVPALDLSLERPRTPPSSKLFPNPTSHESHSHATQSTEKTPLDPLSAPVSTQFNPPQSSRLLAFGARTPNAITAKSQTSVDHLATSPLPNGQLRSNGQQTSNLQPIQPGIFQNSGMLQLEPSLNQGALKSESLRPPPGFSPFEDQSRSSVGFDEPREQNYTQPPDSLRRVSAERPPFTLTSESGVYPDPLSFDPSNGAGYATSKGSRFAKFFDGKAREGQTPMAKAETPVGFVSSSPIPGPRQEQGGFNGGNTDHRAMDDLFAMLNSSAQGQRLNPVNPPNTAPTSGSVTFGQPQNNLQLLQQQQTHHQQAHHVPSNGRLEALYESRLDDRNFMPDGMVPGLRSAPPPRNRESGGMFPESLDDPIHFNAQRLPPQQQRGLDQMYSGPVPSLYAQQPSRNAGIPLQQPHYRGGPSPISGQSSLQRLPPGLANLGGRPPHEPSQFLGMPMPSAALHGNLHGNGPPQQHFNNFAAAGYGGPQMRAPPPGPHQLQNLVAHNPMAGLGHPNNMDLHGPNQAQLLGMGGAGVNVGGLRGVGGGFVPQQGQAAQMQPPLLAMRQQQQQQQPPHLLPHMVPHLVPPHLQQQGRPGINNQPAHDLMALLMGGGPSN